MIMARDLVNNLRHLLDKLDEASMKDLFLVDGETNDGLMDLLGALKPETQKLMMSFCGMDGDALAQLAHGVLDLVPVISHLLLWPEYDVVDKVALGKKVTTRKASLEDMKLSLLSGMIFVKRTGKSRTYVMPREVRSLYMEKISDELEGLQRLTDIYDMCSMAATRLYGVIKLPAFMSLVNGYLQKELGFVWENAEDRRMVESNFINACKITGPCFVKYDSLLYTDISRAEYDSILQARKGKRMEKLDFQSFTSFAFPDYFEDAEAVEVLESALSDAGLEDVHELAMIFGDELPRVGMSIDDAMEFLAIKDEAKAKAVKKALAAFDSTLRHWADYGALRP